MDNSKLPKFLLESTPWDREKNAIWPVTTFKLYRNLGHQLFPNKMDKSQLEASFDALSSAIQNNSRFHGSALINTAALSASDKEFLSERFLMDAPLEETRPGQGILVSEQGDFIAFVNLTDHLCLETVCATSDWDATLDALSALEKELSKTLEFAFSGTFGFLSADPTLCGTGLSIETYLHLPGLIHSGKLDSLIEDLDEDILIHGPAGHTTFYGDIVVIQNKFSLGTTEDQLMACVHKAAAKLHSEEEKVRGKVQKSKDPTFKDRIARAFGLLKSSYQIETPEALEALSLIKLGDALGWIEGLDSVQTNRLFFHCRRGHLALLGAEEEEARARSSLCQNTLEQIQLKI